MVSIAIAFESLYSASGLLPAPYLSQTGTFTAWMNRGRSDQDSLSTLLTLLIVFGLRIGFCWAEMSARSVIRLRGSSLRLASLYIREGSRRVTSLYSSRTASLDSSPKSGNSVSTSGSCSQPSTQANATSLTTPYGAEIARPAVGRQVSVLKLYNRIARSDIDVRHLRYAAACLVVLQPILLVLNAAVYGKQVS